MCKRYAALGVIFILSVSAIGCRTLGGTDANVVYIGGRALSKRVSVENIGGASTETGTRAVWANLRNRTKNRLMVEARAVFVGKDNRPVESGGAWQPIFIEPNTSASFRQFSMSSSAERVAIEIREGNR